MRRIMRALLAVRDECTLALYRSRRKDLSAADRALAKAKYLRLRHVFTDAERAVQEMKQATRP